jgi:hypothetical protein
VDGFRRIRGDEDKENDSLLGVLGASAVNPKENE